MHSAFTVVPFAIVFNCLFLEACGLGLFEELKKKNERLTPESFFESNFIRMVRDYTALNVGVYYITDFLIERYVKSP